MPTQDTWSSVAGLKQLSYGKTRVRTWVVTPNFGSLPKDQKPVNRYDDMLRWADQTAYAAYNIRKSNGVKSYVVPSGPYFTGSQLELNQNTHFGVNSEGVKSIAQNENGSMLKTLGKVSEAKVNVAVSLAEASKTSDLILGTARRIDQAYRAFRRGNLKKVAQILNLSPGRVHKTWLEYKYGWTPLLMEVKGAAEFFAQQHVGRPVRFVVSAVETRSGSHSSVQTYTPYGGAPLATISHHTTWETKAKTKMWCELTNPSYSQLQQLGLTNPALIAWELVPFSFVFDWFISVGDWLQGITALNGVTVRRVMQYSWFDMTYVRSTPATVRSDATYTYHEDPLNITFRKRQFGRGVPSYNIWDLYPPKTQGFGFQKLVTSLALIRGSYRGPARL